MGGGGPDGPPGLPDPDRLDALPFPWETRHRREREDVGLPRSEARRPGVLVPPD